MGRRVRPATPPSAFARPDYGGLGGKPGPRPDHHVPMPEAAEERFHGVAGFGWRQAGAAGR